MRDGKSLIDLVNELKDQYLANAISLNALVHRGEALLEQGRSVLSPEKHQCAMNCVYVIEEINALVLDEGRSMRADERTRVMAELRLLATMVADV